jgi:murein L,D-transpeptidase YcbB/YkuD
MLRQDSGGKNPLGRLKFDLTNGYHIYLHDTPAGAVFGRADRSRSHGCIRVEDAKALAAQITDDDGKEKVLEALAQDEERRIELKRRIPVHIFYWTAWVDDRQKLHFAPDVYDLDPPQQAALERVSGKADTGVLTHFR